ncbi:MAG: TRAP transporter large permease subunit [Spirochaetaceae bacterium]|jgi:Na+/H+ antiporter NhaD/arsenite permease-like protein|nr:TRAP transporter large permease subunit [Spirochaetaceae bacterium]
MQIKLIVLAITIAMYALVIVFQNKKAYAALIVGALIVVLENVVLPREWVGDALVAPFEALFVLVNWSVLMIYIGSLVIAELFIYSRAPARIADNIVDCSPRSGVAIVVILIITGIISAFVENVATVLVMAPIALALSKKINMNPKFFMIGLAVMSNLQGTATLVGDPPSMIFASYARYGFNDFFFKDGRPSIFFFVQIGMLTGALFFYVLFARGGKGRVAVKKTPVASLFPSILFILMIVGLAACSFLLNEGVSLESGLLVMALALVGLFWFRLVRKESARAVIDVVRRLDWETIFFLIGIFVVVGALSKTGILSDFARALSALIGGNALLGFIVIVLVSIVISGFVDNVPYIIAMLPVAGSLSAHLGLSPELLMFALLIGSCLGGNLTPFGASANIVCVGILKREGVVVNFPGWLKVGLPFTVLTTAAASVAVWFVWG